MHSVPRRKSTLSRSYYDVNPVPVFDYLVKHWTWAKDKVLGQGVGDGFGGTLLFIAHVALAAVQRPQGIDMAQLQQLFCQLETKVGEEAKLCTAARKEFPAIVAAMMAAGAALGI